MTIDQTAANEPRRTRVWPKVAGIAGALTFALFALGYSGYLWSRDSDLPGGGQTELAQWLPAVSSVATFVAAAFAAWFAARSYQSQHRQEQALLTERSTAAAAVTERSRREQAEQVVAWFKDDILGTHPPTPGVQLVNTSRIPVYDVVVHLWADESMFDGAIAIDQLEPGDKHRVFPPATRDKYRVLAAQTPTDAAILARGARPPGFKAFRVTLSFRDAANNKWMRDRNGLLHPGK